MPVARDFLSRIFTGEFFQTHRIEDFCYELNNYESIQLDIESSVQWMQEMHVSGRLTDKLITSLAKYFPCFLTFDSDKLDDGFKKTYKRAIDRLTAKVLTNSSTNARTLQHLNNNMNLRGIERLKAGLIAVRDQRLKATALRADEPFALSVRELLELETLKKTESQDDVRTMLAEFDQKTLKIALSYTGIAKDQVMRSLGMESLLPLDHIIRQVWDEEGEDPIYNCDDPSNGTIDLVRIRHITRDVNPKMLASYLSDYAKALCAPKGLIMLIQAACGIDREKTEKNLVRHGQFAIKAYGLHPVQSPEELRSRYAHFKKMHKQASQYGSNRQANTRAAVAAGLSNLAQSAGFTDATRMEWALEADLADNTMALNEWQDAADWQICLRLDGIRPSIKVRTGDKELKSVPSKVRQQSIYKSMRAAQDQIRAQASSFRDTLQAMMCQGEKIETEELSSLRRLPVVASMLSQLILRDDNGRFGLLNPAESTLTDFNGESIDVSGCLQIAHTLHLYEAGVLSAWQEAVVTQQTVQPFKQAFRELYVVTPAEIDSRVSSRRFNGQVVRSNVAGKLLQTRGWSLGNWDIPESQRIFPKQRIVASIGFDDLGHYFAEHAEIRVRNIEFRRDNQIIDMVEVDPLVFSEAMRDADLVAAVAQKTDDYSHCSAEVYGHRQQVVSATIESMGLAGVTVKQKHVLVTGKLANYQIHLGSGAIHIVPGNYLCIVRGREKDEDVYLPFADNDSRLTEIISKVLLLINDDKIKDQSILSQIRTETPEAETI